MASRWQWGLPLFTKELQELAARRRTYVMRVAFVTLLCYFTVATLAQALQNSNPLSALGQGLPVLTSLTHWEFVGIYLFLPAMTCGVFTTEKERNTLALLFLTRLGPWTLIIEKLLSRLFPMLMFLCSALPVMAFTYSMGGLLPFQIFCASWFLFLGAFQLACIAVMCSTLASSTAPAFIQTYVVVFLINFWGGGIFLSAGSLVRSAHDLFQEWLIAANSAYSRAFSNAFAEMFSPFMMYARFLSPDSMMSMGAGTATEKAPWLAAIVLGIPSMLSGITCLLVARWALYRRAFVPPSNLLLNIFRRIDKVFFWANRNVAFDVKLVREGDSLPGNEPIAWREVSKRSLGQFRYLVRVMIPLMFPVVFMGMFAATSSANEWQSSGPNVRLTPLVLFLWSVSLVLIAVAASNSVPLERSRQTWDVLRSMPLTGSEMLIQKLRGVRRLQYVCSIPVLSAIGLQAWWRYQLLSTGLSHYAPGTRFADDHFIWWEYIIGAVMCVWIYSEMVKWIGLWCGLMIRNSMRAILTSGFAVAAVATMPYLIVLYLIAITYSPGLVPPMVPGSPRSILGAACPVSFVGLNELGDLRTIWNMPLVPALFNFIVQGLLLLTIRQHILKHAEWYLGRIGVPRGQKSRAPTPAATSQEADAIVASDVARAY